MHPIVESTLAEVAQILTTILPREDAADLMNLLLVADQDEHLNDRQGEICQMLLTDLCEFAPQAMAIARGE